MKCANPNCQNNLLYLRGGTLRLLELESSPEARLHGGDGGFPVFRQSARYFWLCSDCSRELVLKSWTSEGLIIESRASASQPVRNWLVQAQPAVDRASVLYFRRPYSRTA